MLLCLPEHFPDLPHILLLLLSELPDLLLPQLDLLHLKVVQVVHVLLAVDVIEFIPGGFDGLLVDALQVFILIELNLAQLAQLLLGPLYLLLQLLEVDQLLLEVGGGLWLGCFH